MDKKPKSYFSHAPKSCERYQTEIMRPGKRTSNTALDEMPKSYWLVRLIGRQGLASCVAVKDGVVQALTSGGPAFRRHKQVGAEVTVYNDSQSR